MIPQRNNCWLLDSVAGWQIDADTTLGIAYTLAAGDITIDPLPGAAQFLPESLANCIPCPVALSADNQERLWVLDPASASVWILDLKLNRSHRVEALGGKGAKLRRFDNPRSLAVLPSGAVAVADTGNHRVQLFSPPPYVLLHVWESISPCALACDRCGVVHILDRRTRSILRVRLTGTWLEPLGAGVLTDPVELAVSKNGDVAVVDGRGANSAIAVFPANGDKPIRLTLVQLPLSVAFDAAGNLYVGTGNGLISKLEQDDRKPSGWSLGGDGVSDSDGAVIKIAWIEGHGIYAILKPAAAGTAPVLFAMDPAGAYRSAGTFDTLALNSNIENCTWHRIRLVAKVPEGTSIQIETSTSESPDSRFTPWQGSAIATADNPDCLVQSPPGQYLKLRVTLSSAGHATPQIHLIRAFFPRESYLQYLPAVFQDDPQSKLFLDRFLSIFQTTFDDVDHFLDDLWQIFDPYMTREEWFPWLAAWLAVPFDPGMPLSQKRYLLKKAFQYDSIRGTPKGLLEAIVDYTGVPGVRILEHFKLRDWTSLPLTGGLRLGSRLWSDNLYARLQANVFAQVGSFKLTNAPPPGSELDDIGANRFSVAFPANPYTAADTSAKIVEREKPAHTEAFLCPVYPRLRIGVQARLGIDAYVGKINSMILGKLATLNYDSVLARSLADRQRLAVGSSLYPRLGVDARIL